MNSSICMSDIEYTFKKDGKEYYISGSVSLECEAIADYEDGYRKCTDIEVLDSSVDELCAGDEDGNEVKITPEMEEAFKSYATDYALKNGDLENDC